MPGWMVYIEKIWNVLMLQAKFQDHRTLGSGEDFQFGDIWAWQL